VIRVASFFVVAGLFFVGSTGVIAQATSVLEGHVTDQQGGALVGATVSVITSAQSSPLGVITDATGFYRFSSLQPGVYTVHFAIPGFQTVEESVELVAGVARVLGAELAISPFAQEVNVVGVAPGLGGGVDRSRIPSAMSVIGSTELSERGAASVADTLQQRLGSVTVEGTTSNPVQPTLRFRGFTASPLLGLPQGIAVYQNGVRINEPFGDIVQFDLIPQFAMESIQLAAGAEPTFGLNALGGALALRLKNGFEATGFRGEVQGGSFGRFSGTGEFGVTRGPWAVYLGATRFDEAGWRTASESDVTQAVIDLGYRQNRVDAGATFTYAGSSLNGNGPAPIELLDRDRAAVFTFPDTTENRLAFGQGRVNILLSQAWSFQANGFYRDLDRQTLNGDEAEFSVCDDDALPLGAPTNTLCVGSGDDDRRDNGVDEDGASLVTLLADDDAAVGADDASVSTSLVDVVTGRFITGNDADGNAAFNRSTTRSQGSGGLVQLTGTHRPGGHVNTVVLGVSVDLADVEFHSNSEVGTLTRDRTVVGSGLFAGVFLEAPDDLFNTSLETENRAVGVYFSDTISFVDQWHVTVSGRFNDSQIIIIDRLGTSLNGDHSFSRFNPAVGVVYQVSDALSIVGRYTEANRAPTAAELSCADPEEPCRVPNAFVSDPPLKQAVARSVEGGARGRFSVHGSDQTWSFVAYRTGIRDDILFAASPELLGTGFFKNGGGTRRVGLDAELSGRSDRLAWYASYGLVEATFESSLALPSNVAVNDAASENGEISVEPGDRLPGIPRHSFKLGGRYDVVSGWSISLDGIVASSRIFVGDEGNDQAHLDGYKIVNLRSVYALSESLELFGRVDNVFGLDYATFGVLAEIELVLEEAPDADDPRFVSPGAPRSAFIGARVMF
jgi:outer membrane receptor for Fe3+-dicitrate